MRHSVLARLIAAVVIPALLIVLIEGALRIAGYGYPTSFFVPLDRQHMTTNPKFTWQFYPKKTATAPVPLVFPKAKAPDTLRIFVLGESAAAGTPDPAFGFASMLEVMLGEQYPGRRFEIINAAMRGIDSHIIRSIAVECARFAPDLFIVYAGNNDMIGLHAPAPGEFRMTTSIHWLRFKNSIARLKLMQLGNAWIANLPAKAKPRQDMDFFRRHRLAFDDPQRESVYQQYERNLRDIAAMAERAGAPVVLCTVAVNLRDFPPLGSLHRPGLSAHQLQEWERHYAEGAAAELANQPTVALAKFEAAAGIDDHFAELLYRLARCHDTLGQTNEAQRYFGRARDWDAIQFRMDGRMNAIVRSVATNAPGRIRLLDVEQELARGPFAENGVPGTQLFQEHVHFTFAGDHQAASILLPAVASTLQLPASAKPLPTRDDCARALAYTLIDDINVRAAVNRLTSNPPFLDQLDHAVRQLKADHQLQQRLKAVTERDSQEAITIYQTALAARPNDWRLHLNYANLLAQLNRHAAAVPHYAEVVKRLPNQHKFRASLGSALLQAGQMREAREQFEAVLRDDPDFAPAREGLSLVNARR